MYHEGIMPHNGANYKSWLASHVKLGFTSGYPKRSKLRER